MLKKPPDFGGLTHKIRKIVFSCFRCPIFAFLVSRLSVVIRPTAVWTQAGYVKRTRRYNQARPSASSHCFSI